MLKIFVTQQASSSLLKDLKDNKIHHNLIKGFTSLEIEDTDKAKIAIRMVKERFGLNSIIIK